jgi:O-antigen/teichoic acid export membrane protein
VWALFLPLVAGAGAVVVWLAPTIVRASAAQHATVRLAAGFLVLSFIVATLAAVPEAVLRGLNLGYKRMGWQAALNVIGGLLLVGALSTGLGLAGLGAAQVALFVLTGACFWILARRYVPSFGTARPTRNDVRRMVGMSAWLAVGDLTSKLLLASDVIVLGMVVSPAMVTTYVLTGYATRTALGIFGLTVGAAMPGIGGLVGQAQYQRAAALRSELLALTWLFCVSAGATVLVWNPAFLHLWVGAENYAGGWANLLMVCIMTQTMFIRSDSYLIDIALRPRDRVLVGAAAAVITIGAAIPLTHEFGVIGLCLGILIGRALQSIAYPLIVASCLRTPAGAPLRALVRPVVVTAAILAAAAELGERVTAGGWVVWGLGVAASLVAAPALALFAGLQSQKRVAVLNRVRTAVRSMRG